VPVVIALMLVLPDTIDLSSEFFGTFYGDYIPLDYIEGDSIFESIITDHFLIFLMFLEFFVTSNF
jgi:hypothetical protein